MSARRILLAFAIFGALLMLTRYFGNLLIQAIYPMYEWMIRLLDYRFDRTLLYVNKIHGENYLQLEVEISRPFWLGAQQIAPTQAIYNSAGMALANVLQPIALVFTVILAWPAKRAFDFVARSLLAMPITLLIMMADMPFQLVNSTWQGLQQSLNLNLATTTWFNVWSDFLNGGGLAAISLASGLLVVGIVNRMQD